MRRASAAPALAIPAPAPTLTPEQEAAKAFDDPAFRDPIIDWINQQHIAKLPAPPAGKRFAMSASVFPNEEGHLVIAYTVRLVPTFEI